MHVQFHLPSIMNNMLPPPSLPSLTATTISTLPPDIIRHHILTRLDGPALAAASCVSSDLLSLCNDDSLWKHACNSTWPSTLHPDLAAVISAFPSAHRSFFSDAFPARRPSYSPVTSPPKQLIFAVDIYSTDGEAVYSKVLATETVSSWFLNVPFMLYLLDSKIPIDDRGGHTSSCAIIGRQLRLSWIVIDPVKRRAVNVASRKAVESRRHWLTNDVMVQFARVVDVASGEPAQCAVVVVVRCGVVEEIVVKEVSMHVEDMDGNTVTGREVVDIMAAAMEGQQRGRGSNIEEEEEEEEEEVYEGFVRIKEERRERRERREKVLDMLCIGLGILIFYLGLLFITISIMHVMHECRTKL